ncbi:hypothetical protein ACIBBB_00280 [Streptomyces sp. NPDC051217]|uniref:hypothetical protein n=1 Tax=Streptomyces sp. NPDC051217 TaxID=3365644 RepID=UPI0037AA30E0
MTGNAKIGVALVGGYLLGRTKKAKMAIGFGMFLAGKKLSFDPRQLGKLVGNSPVLGSLNDQVRKELVGATKTAATNALTQRASGLADSLHRRTLELDGKEEDREEPAREREDDEPEDREQADNSRDSEPDEKPDEGPDEKPAPRRKPAAKAPAQSAGRSAAKATSGARRTASGGARKKTASGARKTASSAGRDERGGRK